MHIMSVYSDGTSENWWLLGVDWSLQAEMAPLYLGLKAFLIYLFDSLPTPVKWVAAVWQPGQGVPQACHF